MIVRQLTIDDCQAVADLETQLFNGRFDAAGLRELLNKPAFYGAVMPARNSPNTIFLLFGLHYAHAARYYAIGTERANQGRGFGKTILQHFLVVTEQQNVAKIELEVAVDNMSARRLYESCGFHVSGFRKDYYYRGESRCDAIIMARQRDSAFP